MKSVDRFFSLIVELRKLKLFELPIANHDLSFAQLQVIEAIAQLQDGHLQDVAAHLGLSAPTVSVAVKTLEEAGWVQRSEDPKDRRAYIFSLTSKCHQMVQLVKNERKRLMEIFMSGLSKAEQDQFISLFEKAIDAAKNSIKPLAGEAK